MNIQKFRGTHVYRFTKALFIKQNKRKNKMSINRELAT